MQGHSNRSRRRNGLALVVAVLAPIAITSTPTAALATTAPAPGVRITRIQYDSRGADTRTNVSLNREFVVLRNRGAAPVDLKGYTIRDKSGHTFTFAGASVLAVDATIAIFTGKGNNTATYRHWGMTAYVWNNAGDTASFLDPAKHLLQTCSWATVAPGYKNC